MTETTEKPLGDTAAQEETKGAGNGHTPAPAAPAAIDYRSHLLGRPANLKVKTIELDGVPYEIRDPTPAMRDEIVDRSGGIIAANTRVWRFRALLIIYMLHKPTNGGRVFEDTDLDAILNRPANEWLGKASDECLKLFNESEKTPKN